MPCKGIFHWESEVVASLSPRCRDEGDRPDAAAVGA
jgi:hypothetical protein